MVDGKEDSTIKKVPSLTFFCARVIYYINLNVIYNLEKEVADGWICECKYFSGCEKINGVKDYCDICSLSVKYSSIDEEKNLSVKNLIKKNISLIKDFKKYPHIDILNDNIQNKNIDFNKNGTFSQWSFYNYVFNSPYFKPDDFKMYFL